MSRNASLGEAVLDLTADDSKLKKTTSTAKANVENILGKIGVGMSAVGTGIAAAGTAIVAVGAGMVAMAAKAAATADELLVLSAKTGVSVEKLQEMKYAAELVDVPLETMTGSFSRLTMAMGESKDLTSEQAGLFKTLGVDAIDPLTGKLRSTYDVWLDTIDALGKIDNQAERDAISLKLFGRSAAELNPLIVAGAETLKQYGVEAHLTGNILSTEVVEAAGKLDDALQRMKSTISTIVFQLGAELAPGIETFVNLVTGYISRFSSIISDEGLTAEEKIAAISTVVTKIVLEIRDRLPQFIESGMGILKSLITGIVMAIPVLVPTIVEVLLSIVQFIMEMLPIILNGAVQIVIALALGIAKALPKLIPAIVGLLMNLIKIVMDNFPILLDAGLKVVVGLVEGIIDAIPVLVESIPTLIQSIVDATIDSLPMIIEVAAELIVALVLGLIESIPLLLAAIPEIIKALVDKFTSPEFAKEMKEVGKELVAGIWKGVQERWSEFIANMKENIKKLVAAINELLGIHSPSRVFAGIGANMMVGMAQGIDRNSMLPALASSQAVGAVSQSTVNNYYSLTGNYQYQSETTLMDQVRMLNLLGGA